MNLLTQTGIGVSQLPLTHVEYLLPISVKSSKQLNLIIFPRPLVRTLPFGNETGGHFASKKKRIKIKYKFNHSYF